jgi:hypothetical protein
VHELLCERLAGFELRGTFGGAENRPTILLEAISEAVGQRRFRTNDGEIDALAIDEPNDRCGVQWIQRRGRNGSADASVTRRANNV